MFDYEVIPIRSLLLDPANPRFAHDLEGSIPKGKTVQELQEWTLEHFRMTSDNSDEEDETKIVTYNEEFDTDQLTRIIKVSGLSNHLQIYPCPNLPILFKSCIE